MKYNGKEYYSQGDIYNAIEKENKELRKQKGELRQRLNKLQEYQDKLIWVKENKELLKENRKLKAELKVVQRYENIELEVAGKRIEELEEENKKLKEKYDGLWKIYTSEANELKEENKKLKESLDIATKCSSKEEDGIIRLSEENEKLNLHIEAKDKAYMDLLADYNYLKARIKRTERAFLKYQEKHQKSLGDLDMIIMNR